jgi:hypothetical protein
MKLNKHILTVARRALLLACGIVMLSSHTLYAQNFTTNDLKSINDVTPWYDPNFGGCTTGGGVSTSLVGSDNVQKAYNFFMGWKGSDGRQFKDFQAAGILGNLMQESGVNPQSNQAGGPGRGIAQWSEGGRWEALKSWVEDNSPGPQGKEKDPETLEAQLAFLMHEMTSVAPWKEALPAVLDSQTVEQAVEQFEKKFEKAGKPVYVNRIKYARQVLNQYGGGGNTVNPTTGEAVSECPADSGGASQMVNGYTVYNQCDPAWANKPYGSSKICPSGCGPSAMAMILTALLGQRITPDVVAEYAGSQGMYIPGVGSSWAMPGVVAKKWGVKAQAIGGDIGKINAALKAGGMVIVSGSGPLPWTSGGHYIAIMAVTADGKWKIGDSGHKNTSGKDWDPAAIMANGNGGSVYAISK